MSDPVTSDHYFGGCPECGDTDGYVNAGRGHFFVCDKHKTMWYAGSNVFSSWKDETEEEQREIWEKRGFNEYRMVEPVYGPDAKSTAQIEEAENRILHPEWYEDTLNEECPF